ncbi:unnamed protein product, partial [Rotaria sordida]
MLIEIEHWSADGNRFIIVDNRKNEINNQWNMLVNKLCRRNNLSDAEGVMWGNGGRCAVRHAVLTENLSNNKIELILNGCSYKSKLLDNNRVALEFPLYKELRFID